MAKLSLVGIISEYAATCSSTRKAHLPMWAARPAARPPHPFLLLRAVSLVMLLLCLVFLDGDGSADLFVARKRRYVFPLSSCLRVTGERFPEITREVMYNTSGDLKVSHRDCLSMIGSG